MGYNAITFTTGEQPTTAEWNKLGGNDASFNDGTGIANLEIGSGHTSLKNDHKFRVYITSGQSIGSGATSKILFDTKTYDTGTNFDAVTNHRFVAPVAGFYTFKASSALGLGAGGVNAGSTFRLDLYKNGVVDTTGVPTSAAATSAAPGSIVDNEIQLAANDYIEVFAFNGDSTSRSVPGGAGSTYFTGRLSSQT